MSPLFRFAFLILAVPALAGCHRDMYDQPRYEPLEASELFPGGMSAQAVVPGTVARGQLNEDEAFYTGRQNGELVAELPLEIERALLERGQERFNIFCSPCHARTGEGNGMIVQRGFRRPPSYYLPRLREAPAGHFFDVMTNGFGAMPSYRNRLEPRDRWAIAAYIRVLQVSRQATLDDVPPEQRARLEEATP